MDDGSHHTREFLSYCEDHKIIPAARCVCILKHWHSEAVNRAVQMGDD